MSGLILALLSFAVFFVAHIAVSHIVNTVRKESLLLMFMLAACATYVVVFVFEPAFLARFRVLSRSADGVSGAAAVGFLALGYVEFWSLVERSFSLRILLDTEAAESGLTQEELSERYGGGRGLRWMMLKRINDLVRSGLLVPVAGTYRLSPKARRLAWFLRALQSMLGSR